MMLKAGIQDMITILDTKASKYINLFSKIFQKLIQPLKLYIMIYKQKYQLMICKIISKVKIKSMNHYVKKILLQDFNGDQEICKIISCHGNMK